MTTKIKHAEYVDPIKCETPEMAAFLQPVFGMTLEEVQDILESWKADKTSVPYELYQKAKAFWLAYSTECTVTSTTEGWVRQPYRPNLLPAQEQQARASRGGRKRS